MMQFPFSKKISWSDVLFGIFVVLLLIPQTRKPIQVGLNRAKILVWNPTIKHESKIDMVKPFNYDLKQLNGERTRIKISQGQPVFLSYWATWCPPCVAELPSIQKLHSDYGNRAIFLLVTSEEPEVVNKFMAQNSFDMPVYFTLNEAPEILQSSVLPTNYLIDGDGNILIKETGAANWNSKKVRDLLDKLTRE
ncbi:TlpA family protein disulfide reductase [Croceivirga thetidis]|uniref:TlpA family protein disulfide reductase n=1 Tax=Croceivirga thetidis TaxID=2721623 RepID=A0ABX1GPU6_9FLAO|nr:TlpA disulfide reductase family protein [Croceivirga thetidis]NKI31056.1 TlpA family protein disulfide reductase [Croceivirga thetidis]